MLVGASDGGDGGDDCGCGCCGSGFGGGVRDGGGTCVFYSLLALLW